MYSRKELILTNFIKPWSMKVCMNQCPPYDFGLFRTLEIILGVVKGKQNAVTIFDKLLSC